MYLPGILGHLKAVRSGDKIQLNLRSENKTKKLKNQKNEMNEKPSVGLGEHWVNLKKNSQTTRAKTTFPCLNIILCAHFIIALIQSDSH